MAMRRPPQVGPCHRCPDSHAGLCADLAAEELYDYLSELADDEPQGRLVADESGMDVEGRKEE